jgi:hypothetical protein
VRRAHAAVVAACAARGWRAQGDWTEVAETPPLAAAD